MVGDNKRGDMFGKYTQIQTVLKKIAFHIIRNKPATGVANHPRIHSLVSSRTGTKPVSLNPLLHVSQYILAMKVDPHVVSNVNTGSDVL